MAADKKQVVTEAMEFAGFALAFHAILMNPKAHGIDATSGGACSENVCAKAHRYGKAAAAYLLNHYPGILQELMERNG